MTEEQVKNKRRRGRRHRKSSCPRELPNIFFCGDPHGCFDQINEAARLYKPDAMVLLGDLQPPAPLEQVLEEAIAYTDIWWIPGNHDTDTDHFYDYLWRSELRDRNLHGRTVNIGGLRIGGLGGVFRGQVWMPEGAPNYYSPSTFMRRCGFNNVWRGGVPRRHRTTIFPSVYNNLLRQKADILVTHEAPGCHKKGFAAIDKLGQALGVKWMFHGHQHEDRVYGQHCGITARAVGYRGVVNLNGEVVIAAKLDPREEAALEAAFDWEAKRNTILVRDEDGTVRVAPADEHLTPAILPPTVGVPVSPAAEAETEKKVDPDAGYTQALAREVAKKAPGGRYKPYRTKHRRSKRRRDDSRRPEEKKTDKKSS